MKVEFRASFAKDLRSVKDKGMLKSVKDVIESVEKAPSLSAIQNLKKLESGGSFYRIRTGDFRVGISFMNDTVIFIRFLNRKDIYKYFP
ncbi:type II toxin-antitoxin system RelE/ParE family toxin [bacterium]|nr:type II toxin-antitoxin system RelE/ParE family toxin [bacterium]